MKIGWQRLVNRMTISKLQFLPGVLLLNGTIIANANSLLILFYPSEHNFRLSFILNFRKQWVVGIVFSMFIPSYTPTIGTLANIKS